MPLYVLTGPDGEAIRERRDELARAASIAAGHIERFDVSDDGGDQLLRAATSASLFGGPRLLEGVPLGTLKVDHAHQIVTAHSPGVTVVLRDGSAPSSAMRKALAGASFETFAFPSAREAAGQVATLAQKVGIRVEPEAHRVLTGLAPTDWPRVRSALRELQAMGRTVAVTSEVEALVGTASAPSAPWTLTDALERGDRGEAMRLSAALEPISTVAYIGKRVGLVGRAREGAFADAAGAAGALGVSAGAARRLLGLAGALGEDGMARSLDLVATAAREVKVSRSPHDVLTVLVLGLAPLWCPRPGR